MGALWGLRGRLAWETGTNSKGERSFRESPTINTSPTAPAPGLGSHGVRPSLQEARRVAWKGPVRLSRCPFLVDGEDERQIEGILQGFRHLQSGNPHPGSLSPCFPSRGRSSRSRARLPASPSLPGPWGRLLNDSPRGWGLWLVETLSTNPGTWGPGHSPRGDCGAHRQRGTWREWPTSHCLRQSLLPPEPLLDSLPGQASGLWSMRPLRD